MPAQEREIPQKTLEKWNRWLQLSNRSKNTHYTVGFSSAVLSAALAASAKSQFPSPGWKMALGALAAGLTFLLTALGSQKKGRAFEAASRHLERAIAKFRTDDTADARILGQSEAEGIDLLEKLGE
jgi:hypothetical protein